MVRENKKKMGILGVGMDKKDDQVRVTRGRNFHLVGGSKETHEAMQEKCIKFNEKLAQRGKEMEDLEAREMADIAEQCDMRIEGLPKPRP